MLGNSSMAPGYSAISMECVCTAIQEALYCDINLFTDITKLSINL